MTFETYWAKEAPKQQFSSAADFLIRKVAEKAWNAGQAELRALLNTPAKLPLAEKVPTKRGALRVFVSTCDSFRYMPASPSGGRQADLAMYAKSKAEFMRKCDMMRLMYRKTEVRDCSKMVGVDVIVEHPGVLFWRPLSRHGEPFRPVIMENES